METERRAIDTRIGEKNRDLYDTLWTKLICVEPLHRKKYVFKVFCDRMKKVGNDLINTREKKWEILRLRILPKSVM